MPRGIKAYEPKEPSEMELRLAIAVCNSFVDGRPVNGGPIVYQAVHRIIEEITRKEATCGGSSSDTSPSRVS